MYVSLTQAYRYEVFIWLIHLEGSWLEIEKIFILK